MKIVTYNIQFGLGKDGLFDLERIANEVNGADVIALQEVERYWKRSGNIDQPAQLAQFLDNYYCAYGPYFDVDASTSELDGRINNARRQFGNMILSKTPILSTRLFPLPKSNLLHRQNMNLGIFEGVVKLHNGSALRIYNVHLSARSAHDRVLQIDSIRKIIHRVPNEGGAWTGPHEPPKPKIPQNILWEENSTPPPMPESFVLLGDFNLRYDAHEYNHLVGPMDGHLGRVSSKEHFIDTWVASGHQEDDGATFSYTTDSGEIRGMRFDYAFVDKSMKKQVLGARIDQEAQGSDHQPYWIDLDCAPHS
jgi:endonuclease/exonuclease/phosphatase family metal-dependent hydrolase